MENNDAEIIRKVLNGQKEAFSEIADKYASLVASIAYSIVNNSETAKDIAQDSLFDAFLKLDKLKDIDKFKSWLCQITKNKAINWVKSNIAKKKALKEVRKQKEKTEKKNTDKEDEMLIAIGKLNEIEREITLLRYYNELSRGETSEFLSISEAAADKRLQRAIKKLKDLLK